ncbi:MAG: zinc ribbon domain-containing protein [Candidatus Aminicenantes bacterium]|nr:zinc ribbon domain-containing protein [Candidatus Aminicenantes bacterium]
MPIYEYKCENCRKDVEIFLKTISSPAVTCPHCGSDKLEKQWSVPAVITNNTPDLSDMPPCGGQCEMPQSCPASSVCGCAH